MTANGVGSIHTRIAKAGKKYYDVYYRAVDPKTGEKKQKVKRGFIKKKDANDFLNNISEDIRHKKYITPSNLTVDDVMNQWFEEDVMPRLRPNTINGYRINKDKHILPYIGKVPIQMLSADHLQTLYNKKYSEKLSPTSVRYIHKNIRLALNFAIRKRYIFVNPALDPILKIDKNARPKFEILSFEEVLDLLINKINDEPIAVPIALAALLGLRRGEIAGLKWSDIDFRKKIIHIRQQRTVADAKCVDQRSAVKTVGSDRKLDMPDIVRELLVRNKQGQDDIAAALGVDYFEQGYVFCRLVDGKPYHPNTISKAFADVLKKHNLKHIRFHDLRHSYATSLIHLGIPITTVARLMGHESPDITLKVYAHVLDDMYMKDVNTINDIIKNIEKETKK